MSVKRIQYLYPHIVLFFNNDSSLSSFIKDLILSSTTTILCFVMLKLKLSGLIKLPKITRTNPDAKDVKLPNRRGISWLVEATEISHIKKKLKKAIQKHPAKVHIMLK